MLCQLVFASFGRIRNCSCLGRQDAVAASSWWEGVIFRLPDGGDNLQGKGLLIYSLLVSFSSFIWLTTTEGRVFGLDELLFWSSKTVLICCIHASQEMHWRNNKVGLLGHRVTSYIGSTSKTKSFYCIVVLKGGEVAFLLRMDWHSCFLRPD